jgi:transposase
MEQTKRVARRTHGAELKRQVLALCEAPRASVARIALEHGLNASLVHRWRRIVEGCERGAHAKPSAASECATWLRDLLR